jgi:hypothetical protein
VPVDRRLDGAAAEGEHKAAAVPCGLAGEEGGVTPVPCLHDGEIELGRQRACDDDIPAQGVVEVACGLTMSIART